MKNANTLDQLRGYEGAASARYFDIFDLLLKNAFGFEKRIRQPPTDPVNSLLSFGYTLLFYNVYSLLTIVSQFFEKYNVYAVVGTQHAVSLRYENTHEIYISLFYI